VRRPTGVCGFRPSVSPLIRAVIVTCALLIGVHPALAAFDTLLTVAQPMEVAEAGAYQIHFVTYQYMLGSPLPGIEISLTNRDNVVSSGDGSRSSENRNSASEAGFLIRVEDRSNGTTTMVDTLDVSLDVSRAAMRADSESALVARLWRQNEARYAASRDTASLSVLRARATRKIRAPRHRLEQLVRATIDCILDNAYRGSPRIRRVRLTVAGSQWLAGLSKVYLTHRAPLRATWEY
jgi:hypothetical protein